MQAAEREPGESLPFSEKGFYLEEFRGRTLAVIAAAADVASPAPLEAVLKELAANATRVVLLSDSAAVLAGVPDTPRLRSDAPRLEGSVWQALRAAARVGVEVPGSAALGGASCELALRLRISKLVWIDAGGALCDPEGRRLSFVDLSELRARLAAVPPADAPRSAILREVERALGAGLPAVNLCSLEGLADELFTYAGSGTLFSRERYVAVRSLGIDDFDAAHDLIARGAAEGFLAPRSPGEIERVLVNGFGAFVEGRHLAGIGALLQWEGSGAAEIASLYTLTRFVGEGIGGHLVAFACESAGEIGCERIFAVTTSDRVAAFFERQGFARVAPEEIPEPKWRGYDAERRARARCLCRRL